MPLQNRVNPWGTIFRSSARGTFMGNRGGVLHNNNREIVRVFKSRQWITCVLEFKGRQRSVMSPRLYTELFFLDEAVALAAGHRPCAECRRERFNTFRNTWMSSKEMSRKEWMRRDGASGAFCRAPEIDAELHPARIGAHKEKLTYDAPLDLLPDGCFVEIEESAYLVLGDALLLWAPEGYIQKNRRPDGLAVTVLTPGPIVDCLREGYKPQIYDSHLRLNR